MAPVLALKKKGAFTFSCVSDTPQKFEERVGAAYWRWRGIQPRGAPNELVDFLAAYDKVEVAITDYKE